MVTFRLRKKITPEPSRSYKWQTVYKKVYILLKQFFGHVGQRGGGISHGGKEGLYSRGWCGYDKKMHSSSEASEGQFIRHTTAVE